MGPFFAVDGIPAERSESQGWPGDEATRVLIRPARQTRDGRVWVARNRPPCSEILREIAHIELLVCVRLDLTKGLDGAGKQCILNAYYVFRSVTLFEQLGGQDAVEAAVDNFYRKVLTDDRVSSFFDDVDMDRQRAKQKAFLTMAFGGPNNYSGKDMRTAHARLVAKGLNDSHVDAIIELLGSHAPGHGGRGRPDPASGRDRRIDPQRRIEPLMPTVRYEGHSYELKESESVLDALLRRRGAGSSRLQSRQLRFLPAACRRGRSPLAGASGFEGFLESSRLFPGLRVPAGG